jgi:hypothetical protein
VPRPAHVAPQPPALPLTFGPQQAPEMFQNRFQLEPLPLRRPGYLRQVVPQAAQQGQVPPPRRSPDLVQRELEMLFDNLD